MKILPVEDDGETAECVARGLTEAGHLVDRAADGREGLILASDGGYDAVVVDRMLPKLYGLGLVRALRAAGVKTPALFLTARAGVGDRVEELEAGGDDCLVKPCAFAGAPFDRKRRRALERPVVMRRRFRAGGAGRPGSAMLFKLGASDRRSVVVAVAQAGPA